MIWVFPTIGGPQIIHFNRVFHYKPSILGYHYFWKHPYIKGFCILSRLMWAFPHLEDLHAERRSALQDFIKKEQAEEKTCHWIFQCNGKLSSRWWFHFFLEQFQPYLGKIPILTSIFFEMGGSTTNWSFLETVTPDFVELFFFVEDLG